MGCLFSALWKSKKRVRASQDGKLACGEPSQAAEACAASIEPILDDDARPCSEAGENVTTVKDDSRTHAESHGLHTASGPSEPTSTPHEAVATSLHESSDDMRQTVGNIGSTTDLDSPVVFASECTPAVAGSSHDIRVFLATDKCRSPDSAVQHLDHDQGMVTTEDEAQSKDDADYSLETISSSTSDAASHPPTKSNPPAELESNDIIPRATMLAATLPEELFSIIIDAAGSLYWLDQRARRDLNSCSLVCVYWAKRFRPLAHGGRHYINSEKQALRLRDLVLGPCSDRFTPLVDLIGGLWMVATTSNKRSWHHLLAALVPLIPAHKLACILILGFGTPFRSLHWGIPSSVTALPMPYRELTLANLRFASLQHIIQLVRKLPRLETLELHSLKWYEDAPRGNTAPRQQATSAARSALTRVRVRDCQDAPLLLLRLLLAGSARVANPLQVLPPPEQAAIIQLIDTIVGATKARFDKPPKHGNFHHRPTLSSGSVISRSSISLRLEYRLASSLYLYYERTVIGCAVVFNVEDDYRHQFVTALSAIAGDNLWSALALFPDLRYLIVGFPFVSFVQKLAKANQTLWTSLAQRLHYFRFASQPIAGEHEEWVAHDPGSLDLTGEKWTDVYDHVKLYHGEAMDSTISARMDADRAER